MNATNGNGELPGGNGAGNGKGLVPQRKGKLIGGITGKGFKPGQSGNPLGGKLARQKESFAFGNYLRDWLAEQAWIRDADGKKIGKEVRLKTIVDRLAHDKPEVLLHYAYGKPVEVHEVAAAEGTELEFVVRVNGKDVP